jgi:50S ribosomal protein L16 3-hydroxylase
MRASRSGFGSTLPERKTDILQALFGIPDTEFLRHVARKKYLLHHGAAGRLDALLGAGNVSNLRALKQLAVRYGRQIGRVIYDERGILALHRLRVSERRRVVAAQEACYFFSNYDAPFREVGRLRQALCAAFGSRLRGSNCSGTLQTRGASLPRHCDRTDVIVLQIFGTRRWRLQRNSDPPRGLYALVRSPTRQRNGWSSTFAGDSQIVNLRPGSALYVPRGWWHETRSAGNSFALVISITQPKKRY